MIKVQLFSYHAYMVWEVKRPLNRQKYRLGFLLLTSYVIPSSRFELNYCRYGIKQKNKTKTQTKSFEVIILGRSVLLKALLMASSMMCACVSAARCEALEHRYSVWRSDRCWPSATSCAVGGCLMKLLRSVPMMFSTDPVPKVESKTTMNSHLIL